MVVVVVVVVVVAVAVALVQGIIWGLYFLDPPPPRSGCSSLAVPVYIRALEEQGCAAPRNVFLVWTWGLVRVREVTSKKDMYGNLQTGKPENIV